MAIRIGVHQHDFWSAFEFAAEHGAHVVSMSISWDAPDNDYTGWRKACETLLAVGVLHANAAGNLGSESALQKRPVPLNIGSPGNCPPPRLHPAQTLMGGLSSVITCGETNQSDSLVATSGHGPTAWEAVFNDYPYNAGAQMGLLKPDLCAPGGVESCYWRFTSTEDLYGPADGTSAATPAVAGCLALLACACLRAGTQIVPAAMLEALENTAVRIVGQTRAKENHFGAGRVDVYAAYQYGRQKNWW
jgi:hypothetical protein